MECEGAPSGMSISFLSYFYSNGIAVGGAVASCPVHVAVCWHEMGGMDPLREDTILSHQGFALVVG